jgi:F0F1-type ATP synthase assembly protein I
MPEPPEQHRPEDPRQARRGVPEDGSPWRLMHLGLELAVTFLLFFGIGFLLDRRLGTLPWLTVVLTLVGFGAGMYHLIRATSS